MAYWLLKTEPSTYSIDDLKKDKTTNWNGIRNFQARNFLRQMKKGDVALIYHTGDEKAVVGTAKITKEAYPEKTDDGDWSMVDISFDSKLSKPVPLDALKSKKEFQGLLLLKQGRLSVTPITDTEFSTIKSMT